VAMAVTVGVFMYAFEPLAGIGECVCSLNLAWPQPMDCWAGTRDLHSQAKRGFDLTV
jgi:hypothetical protein